MSRNGKSRPVGAAVKGISREVTCEWADPDGYLALDA
jgi:hypothetical protein